MANSAQISSAKLGLSKALSQVGKDGRLKVQGENRLTSEIAQVERAAQRLIELSSKSPRAVVEQVRAALEPLVKSDDARNKLDQALARLDAAARAREIIGRSWFLGSELRSVLGDVTRDGVVRDVQDTPLFSLRRSEEGRVERAARNQISSSSDPLLIADAVQAVTQVALKGSSGTVPKVAEMNERLHAAASSRQAQLKKSE
jgi:hypothetical protein